MKIRFWIPAIVYIVYTVRFVSNSIQVGTVLFTTTDLVRKCWSESDKSLLRARLIMQDVLPDPDCIDFSKTNAIVILLDYFHACYDIINTSTYGKIQNLMFLALSDALGGYLRSYILPLTKRAFYAGQVNYAEAKRIFQLYDDIRVFLKTNGMGWAEPQALCEGKFRVKPLVIGTWKGDSPCKKLYTIEMRGNLRCINTKCSLTASGNIDEKLTRNSKESFEEGGNDEDWSESFKCCKKKKTFHKSKDDKNKECKHRLNWELPCDKTNTSNTLLQDLGSVILKNDTNEPPQCANSKKMGQDSCHFQCTNSQHRERIIIPLPVLDDCNNPHTIAVPFRKKPLRNLQNRNSAFILERYYANVIKCLISKKNTRTDILNFNAQFHAWMVSQVFPHLTDEEWYPGFGAVLRIAETIKKFGAESSKAEPGTNDIGFMFTKGIGFNKYEPGRPIGKERTRDVSDVVGMDAPYHSKRHFIIGIIIIASTWLFTFCACIFYFQAIKCRNSCGSKRLPQQTSKRKGMHYCDTEGGGYKDYDDDRDGRDTIKCKGNQDEKFLNFKFLIRFFNKKNKGEHEVHEGRCNEKEKWRTREEKSVREKKKADKEKKLEGTQKEKKQGMKGEGDIPTFIISNMEPQHHLNPAASPTWPCDPSFIRFEEVGPSILDTPRGHAKRRSDKDYRKQVEPPWKNQHNRIVACKESQGDEKPKRKKNGPDPNKTVKVKTRSESYSASGEGGRKDPATDLKSSTCCSKCPHSLTTTTTNSTSQTQLGDKFSSATMEFLEEVIGRQKKYKKPSSQESTEETETDEEDDEDDGSFSSGSGY